ncbi:hypothetical protein MIZ01_0070 [Sideroxyarcus emersonii]|uniref:Uncharacterized protein n=1 Tax=Sideroxyarcus emersonii TaxID=2764705 RepID=A0AAN2BXR2_9PROT|nr:hypothetical protein MIZ01_0070 [Sideroxyarcus emersonii]
MSAFAFIAAKNIKLPQGSRIMGSGLILLFVFSPFILLSLSVLAVGKGK